MDPDAAERHLLRHTVATLAYRAAKAVRGAPPTFADFIAGHAARTPVEIVSHIGDLMDWALSIAGGKEVWRDATPLAWEPEVERLFATVGRFDAYLASDRPLGRPPAFFFQGPVADALTHVGQLTMLRRLSGAPIRGENYSRAAIEVGHVGLEQAAPRKEFG